MTRHIRIVASTPARSSDAEREAGRFLYGRDQVSAQELADHFTGRGWSMGAKRAGHLLLSLGWTGQVVSGGRRVFRRPSPIADGSWRRRARPWLESVEKDPDLIAAEDRRRRWNIAVLLFAVAAVAWAITMTVRAAL